MGPAEWRLAATAITILAFTLTGCQLVRAIWQGRAVGLRRFRSVLIVELAAGVMLSLPAGAREETFVAGAMTTAPCLGTAGVASVTPHGERLTVAGVGRPAPDCALWAIIEDTRGGGSWLQGPASPREGGWTMELVLGTGETSEPLSYDVRLVAVDATVHEAWQTAALAGAPVAAPSHPSQAAHLAQRLVELHVSDRNPGTVELIVRGPGA